MKHLLELLKRPQVTLLILAILFFIPPLLAIWSYNHHGLWQRGANNQGQLLPSPLLIQNLIPVDGSSKGRWNLWVVQTEKCDQKCKRALQTIQKVKQALGKERMRIHLLASAPQNVELLQNKDITTIPIANEKLKLLNQPIKSKLATQIFIVDPIGNVILAYDDGSASALFHDLRHLLEVSRIG